MKGLEMARTVRMNHVGWAMMRHFRFFLSLQETNRVYYNPHYNCMKSHVYWLSSSLASRTSSASLSSNFPNCFPSYFDTVRLTFCLSSGSISSASWCQASFCEELLHSGKQSCNPLLPAAPGCSQHTWEQTWTTFNCPWKQHIKSPHLIYD